MNPSLSAQKGPPPTQGLKGKIVPVTGAARGIARYSVLGRSYFALLTSFLRRM